MKPGLALVDGKLGIWISAADVKPYFHGIRLFFGNVFDFSNLLVHGDYM
jgi:hypothetical protein